MRPTAAASAARSSSSSTTATTNTPALYSLQDIGEVCFNRKPLWARGNADVTALHDTIGKPRQLFLSTASNHNLLKTDVYLFRFRGTITTQDLPLPLHP